ncbi:zinc finger protein 746-like, partial [Aphis craccivora]
MFKCDQCPLVFTAKHNLTVHQKKSAGVRFPYTVCPSTFSFKTSLNKHLKNAHGIINVTAHLRPLPAAPIIDQQTRPRVIQFAPLTTPQIQIVPQIFVCPGWRIAYSYITDNNGKRTSSANTTSAARTKKALMGL